MCARHRWRLIAVLVGLPTPLAGQSVPPSGAAWTRITDLSGGSAYLEVGTKHGMREGAVMQVLRSGTIIGELVAMYVASSRTACTITSSTTALTIGDSVRYQPTAAIASPPVAAGSPASRRTAGKKPSALRGRAGVRYLIIQQPDGSTLTQPAVDFRLDGSQVGGSPFGVAVDVRVRRTSISGGSTGRAAPTGLTRVYQAAFTIQPGRTRSRWAIGRQFATALSPIGIFDGAALDLNFDRWSAGALLGTQPDAATFSPSGATSEFGVWVQRHNAPGGKAPWSMTVGAIGSYERGEINREFAYLRGTWSTRRFSLYGAQEIDANRGWKREVEGSFATLTSSFATAQLNASDAVTLSAGFDSRRSVRLYRDLLNPEIVFDDAFRRGSWGEVSFRLSSRFRVSTDARSSGGGSEGTAQAITASLLANRLTPLQLGFRIRSTRYTGPTSEGLLTSVALEAAPSNAVRIALNAGQRTSATPDGRTPQTRLTWIGGDLDLALGRSVYLMLSTYRERGTPTASTQSYGAFSWRF